MLTDDHVSHGAQTLRDGSPLPLTRTLLDFFHEHANARPDDTSITFVGRDLTWRELDEASDALASRLAEIVVPGDRVALQLQNCPQFLIALLATWKCRAAVALVGPMYREEETRTLLDASGARVLVTHRSKWLQDGRRAIEGTDVALVITTAFQDFAGTVPEEERQHIDDAAAPGTESLLEVLAQHRGRHLDPTAPTPDDVAALAFTSGTTGRAKATATTHRNLVAGSTSFADGYGVAAARHVQLSIAPYVHVTGLVANLGVWLWKGGRMVMLYRFEANRALDLVEQHRVTWMVAAATAYIALLRATASRGRAPDSLELLLSGGAPIPGTMAQEVRAALGASLRPGYGMTESTTSGTLTPFGSEHRLSDDGIVSVGPPAAGARAAILGEDGSLLPPGETGEVLLAGANVVGGYWAAPDDTAATFRDGWLHTGDVGYLDDDGWLYLVDRIKNLIIVSGYNVWPREVEEVLYTHPAVREAAVVGAPDDYQGEMVKAYVALHDGARSTGEEIIAHCREQLAAYKAPRHVEFLAELPKNPNGKIQHAVLRERERSGRG